MAVPFDLINADIPKESRYAPANEKYTFNNEIESGIFCSRLSPSLVLVDNHTFTVFDEEEERDFNMADQVLGTSSTMNAAATKFHNHVLEFDTATKNLQSAVIELQATWKGAGYTAFVGAMGTWDHHMNIIKVDLTNLSDAVSKSDAVFQSVDSDIQRAFAPYAGL